MYKQTIKAYIYLSLIVFVFPVFSQEIIPHGHYNPYYEKVPEISIFYSVKKHSLTQDYEAIITNRGNVIVSHNDRYDSPKVYNAKLSEKELNVLQDFIMKADIFQYKDNYIVDKDFVKMDKEKLKIKIGNRTKTIVISSASAPPKIRAIINKIDEISQRVVDNNKSSKFEIEGGQDGKSSTGRR